MQLQPRRIRTAWNDTHSVNHWTLSHSAVLIDGKISVAINLYLLTGSLLSLLQTILFHGLHREKGHRSGLVGGLF